MDPNGDVCVKETSMKKLQNIFGSSSTSSNSGEKTSGLGTFGGVYTPSILTILGVIMYLRFGWVVGQVGLVGTLLIVTLATSITFLTGLSISEIATDRVVRAGGAYYMISRSLGIEVGGAVGIPLYIAQTLSVGLYVIGFAESMMDFGGWLLAAYPAQMQPLVTAVQTALPLALAQDLPLLTQKLVGLVTAVVVAGVAIQSAAFAVKIQYGIMAAIALSLLSFFAGHPVTPAPEAVEAIAQPRESFWAVFAVFFPAVTGIMSGVGMSGDLKNPSRSIPTGTLAAVGTGYFIYMLIPIFLARWADSGTLLVESFVMQRMALWGWAILLGVWGATLSSALGSILGAPRVLQALARDRVLPQSLRWLGNGHGPADEPRVGTVITLGVVLLAVAFGDLNILAPILTMFFLTTYMVLNVAAGLENFLKSPSFRPTFRVHWSLSLLGALGCVAVMFLINSIATILAALIVLGVFLWLKQQEIQSAWGDVGRGIWLAIVRLGILKLGAQPHTDARNWRPHFLVLSGIPTRRWPLIEMASALTHNRGLITVASILPSGSRSLDQQRTSESMIRNYMEQRGVEGLVRLTMAEDTFVGAEQLVQTYGLGPLVPNTVLLGASQETDRLERYCAMVSNFYQAQRNILILQDNPERGFGQCRRIDVWVSELQNNGGFKLILAHLLQTSETWRDAEIMLKLVVPTHTAKQPARENLQGLLQRFRILAQPQIFVAGNSSFDSIFQDSSRDADLILLGLAPPDRGLQASYQRVQAMTQGLPTALFVLNSPDFASREILESS